MPVESLPLGELSALGSALLWALNAVMLRPLTASIPALRVTALQYAVVSVFILLVALVLGRLDDALHIPSLQAAALVGAALVGMGVGDTSYIRALGLLGVARSFTFATSGYVLLTTVLAALFLAEPVSLKTVAGAAILLTGMYLVVQAANLTNGAQAGVPARTSESARGPYVGLAFCLLAAVCWGFTASTLKPALMDVDVLAANSLRIPAVALMLNAASLGYHRFDASVYRPRVVLRAGLAGIFGLGLGSLLFLYAIQEAGAGKTAILSSTAPVFAAVLALIVLRERPTRSLAVGTALSVAGTWLVV